MRLYLKGPRRSRLDREDDARTELVVDVEGMTECEAQVFICDVKQRVSVRRRDKEGRFDCNSDECYSPRRRRSSSNRQVIDVNINVND